MFLPVKKKRIDTKLYISISGSFNVGLRASGEYICEFEIHGYIQSISFVE